MLNTIATKYMKKEQGKEVGQIARHLMDVIYRRFITEKEGQTTGSRKVSSR